MNLSQILNELEVRGHCSSIIKVTGNYSDILFGHTTWSDYSFMVRMFKTFNFAFQNPSVVAHQVIMSAYPGVLTSTDDFYITDSKLFVTETTNTIMDDSLYNGNIKPVGSVMSWQRAMAATRMAKSAKEWVDLFGLFNSGTYNNQW